MKVLQINGYESPGSRFHGLAITPLLKKHGIESRHLVWHKDTQNPDVFTFGGNWRKRVNKLIQRTERIFSLQSMLYPHATKMFKMSAFKESDLIHLHIIQSGFMSLSALPEITKQKPVVWTLHDPWAMTGHCIHPFDCARWQHGCGKCPDLSSEFPLMRDTTNFLFNYKRKMYGRSKFDVIVASQWMYNMVKTSPLFENVNIHRVPFGLDLDFFSNQASPYAREKFCIPDNALVIFFRSEKGKFKGLSYIIQALEALKTDQPVYILTVGVKNLLERFKDRFQLIELGWTNDEELLRDAFVASDIFLMPSIAESFGMMAVEAMACSKPVIVFDGTALPETVFVPDVGISVPMHDGEAFTKALQSLVNNPMERIMRGLKGRKITELHYSEDKQVKSLADIYKGIAQK